MFSISCETRAGVTLHHLDNAIDALAIVENIQNETHLPIVITNRATGQVLTIEELRRLANLERSRAVGPITQTTPLTPRISLGRRVNLPSVRIEHAQGDGLRRPVNVGHKRNSAVSLRASWANSRITFAEPSRSWMGIALQSPAPFALSVVSSLGGIFTGGNPGSRRITNRRTIHRKLFLCAASAAGEGSASAVSEARLVCLQGQHTRCP